MSTNPTEAARLRALLGRADLSEQAAATVLEIHEDDMRGYCVGDRPVPRYVILALERVIDMRGVAASRRLGERV